MTAPLDLLVQALEAHQAGRLQEAEAGYRAVVDGGVAIVEAHHLLGVLLHQTGRSHEAVPILRRAVDIGGERAAVLATLGDAERVAGAHADAVRTLRRALALAPADADMAHNLVLALAADGAREAALVEAFAAVRRHPGHDALRALLVALLDGVVLDTVSADVRGVLLALLRDASVSAQPLAGTVLALVRGGDAWQALRTDMADAPVSDAERQALPALADDPLFLALLSRVVVTDLAAEAGLVRLRDALAQTAVRDGDTDWWQACAAAVALAADAGEYVWPRPADVEAMVDRFVEAACTVLVRAAAAGRAAPPPEATPALLAAALFTPIGAILSAIGDAPPADDASTWRRAPMAGDAPAAEAWLAAWPAVLRPLLERQWLHPREEAVIARRLPTLDRTRPGPGGAARDEAAADAAIRAQYEARPYPRWLDVPRPAVTPLSRFLAAVRGDGRTPEGEEILVAGAGTGRQPIQLAIAHPGARITAIDVSAASLAYGARRAASLALPITFVRADLRDLRPSDGRFAHVACVGVLHHLDDPLAGWRTLLDVLAPDGVMKIGLYSRPARRGIRAAQALLDDAGLGDDDPSLRAARALLAALPPTHPARAATDFADFHSLSGLRDLLRNARERDYTLPEITAMLAELGLRFLGMQVSAAVRSEFHARWPDAASARSIEAWAAFEEARPDTFRGMYQFFCARA